MRETFSLVTSFSPLRGIFLLGKWFSTLLVTFSLNKRFFAFANEVVTRQSRLWHFRFCGVRIRSIKAFLL